MMDAGLLCSSDNPTIAIELQINNGYTACGTTVQLPYDDRLQQLGIRRDELLDLADDLTDQVVQLKQLNSGGCTWFGCVKPVDASAAADLVDLLMQCAVSRWKEQGIEAEYNAPHEPSNQPAKLLFNGRSLMKHSPALPTWGVAPTPSAPPLPTLSSPVSFIPPSAPIDYDITAVVPSAPPPPPPHSLHSDRYSDYRTGAHAQL